MFSTMKSERRNSPTYFMDATRKTTNDSISWTEYINYEKLVEQNILLINIISWLSAFILSIVLSNMQIKNNIGNKLRYFKAWASI